MQGNKADCLLAVCCLGHDYAHFVDLITLIGLTYRPNVENAMLSLFYVNANVMPLMCMVF